MKDMIDFERLVGACTYKPGWSISVGNDSRPFIQLAVDASTDASLDSHKRDGTRTPWKSGKRYLSEHMCDQEVVSAVFGLIKDAEMHECHEWFRFIGASIYNPHLSPYALAAVASKAANFNTRENAMTMDEGSATPTPEEPAKDIRWWKRLMRALKRR